MRSIVVLVLSAIVATRGPVLLRAQGPPALPILSVPDGPPVDPGLRFEAAVIRPPDPRGSGSRMITQGGRLEMVGLPVRVLLRNALRVQDDRMFGAPAWVDTELYAVNAKAPDDTPANAMPVLIGNLLKERFKLVAHAETRLVQGFNLVIARSDRKLGRALNPSSAECARCRAGPSIVDGSPVHCSRR